MAIERLFIGEGVKEMEVKRYLYKELKRSGLAGITIQRTPLVTRIVLHCDRPALVIGRKGKNVKQITKTIEDVYKIEKPELEIKKVDMPNLEPNIVAYRIASALERNMNPRKVGYKALQAVMRDGAKGIEIIMSGKLIGKGGRARTLKMHAGYMKKCGRPAIDQVLHGLVTANCKPGVIGVEVNIVPPNVHFPDELTIANPADFEVAEEVIDVTVVPTEEKNEEIKAGEVLKTPAKAQGAEGGVKPKTHKDRGPVAPSGPKAPSEPKKAKKTRQEAPAESSAGTSESKPTAEAAAEKPAETKPE
jgi:small subunit ribosomal protein S3